MVGVFGFVGIERIKRYRGDALAQVLLYASKMRRRIGKFGLVVVGAGYITGLRTGGLF